jgi:hypothetical protein
MKWFYFARETLNGDKPIEAAVEALNREDAERTLERFWPRSMNWWFVAWHEESERTVINATLIVGFGYAIV